MFRLAVSKSQGNARMLTNLGILLEERGRLDEARELFAAALKADPNLYEAREKLKRVGN